MKTFTVFHPILASCPVLSDQLICVVSCTYMYGAVVAHMCRIGICIQMHIVFFCVCVCPFSFRSRKYDDVFAEALSAVIPKLPILKRLQ